MRKKAYLIHERDVYKQVIEAHQRTLTTLQWAIGIIGTLLLALVAYAIFKSNKDYKEARDDAKEACKEARQWEKEARSIRDKLDALANMKLNEIDKLAGAELGNIRTQANDALDEIRKQGKEQIKGLITEAETEREVSELWNEAIRLNDNCKYAEARDKWRQILELKPEIYGVYLNLCTTLTTWAMRDKNDRLFDEARSIYDKLKTLPSSHKDEPVIRYCLAEAGFNLITAYADAEPGKMKEARSIYDEIKSLAATFNGEPAIRENQAMAGVNLVSMYGKAGNLDDTHDIYKELKALAEKYKDETTIQECQARAGISLTATYVKAGKKPEAKALLDEVESLVKKLPEGKSQQKLVVGITQLRQKPGMQ